MNYNRKCVALILAGGKGSRLGILTKNLAKPAIPFGGKYRIIDFTLSNCYNSGINAIGVLTQYQPLTLNSYIGIGSHWDLDRKNGGVFLLPPYEKEKEKEWYKGTANAIFQNINFVDMYNPSYLLVLSGDHIYKMDYSKMIQYHIEKNAQATIAVIEVPWKEANRFGILSTNEDGKIIEFEEKPQLPKSNFASMGVYIFNWPVLKEYLLADERDEKSDNDFGKNIIPAMLKNKLNIYAYNFHGYWKDVGTVETLWEANMDLLNEKPQLDIYDPDWCIYSVDPIRPPQYIDNKAVVKNSLINEGCLVFGEVQHSVLFSSVKIGKNSYVKDSIIMHNVTIGENVEIYRSIVGENAIIEDNCIISNENAEKINIIGEKMTVYNEEYLTQNREIER